jgi:hypothetical protein
MSAFGDRFPKKIRTGPTDSWRDGYFNEWPAGQAKAKAIAADRIP